GAATGGGPGSGGGGSPPLPCTPDPTACPAADLECLALRDNAGLDRFGLRVQQMTIFKPDAFVSGLEYTAITQALTMNLPSCYLAGGGTINLLVEMDRAAGMATIGGAKPVADPFDGYSFASEMVEVSPGVFYDVSPKSVAAVVEPNGMFSTSEIGAVTLPLYLDQAGTSVILMPIHEARAFDVQLSNSQNCVGTFNAGELDPGKGCLPELNKDIKSFVEGGKLDGYVSLEEADEIVVTAYGLNRTLCVVLAQDVGEFGTGSNPTRCARKTDGSIKFPGDWCAATNSPADPSCSDAARFFVSFAASGVTIKP
ncbi:MAG: hypothetical protein KC731_27635, partial [Myxococcales bacterium]|nr:hypothetical protein [Myxococcales bacterium]